MERTISNVDKDTEAFDSHSGAWGDYAESSFNKHLSKLHFQVKRHFARFPHLKTQNPETVLRKLSNGNAFFRLWYS